jgi:hypothetical protein
MLKYCTVTKVSLDLSEYKSLSEQEIRAAINGVHLGNVYLKVERLGNEWIFHTTLTAQALVVGLLSLIEKRLEHAVEVR